MKTLPQFENKRSTRYVRILQRWAAFALRHFQKWDIRPRCGFFFGGVGYYGQETSSSLSVLSMISTSPLFDETIVTASQKEVKDIAIQAIRYLCFTHDTGPEDCVRPEKGYGNPALWGTKWGERGKGFFPESQTGRDICELVTASFLLHEEMDVETNELLLNIVRDYLDRFGNMIPRSGSFYDTQMEENAWTSAGLAACCSFLRFHNTSLDRIEQWEQNARKWMFATATIPEDLQHTGKWNDSTSVQTYLKQCGNAITVQPDFTVENHGMFHPNYAGTCLTFSGYVLNLYTLLNRPIPPELLWHRQDVYNQLKKLTDQNGFIHCPQGMDWPNYNHSIMDLYIHGIAYSYLNDTEAGYFEDRGLDRFDRITKSNNGSIYPPDTHFKCSNFQDPMIISENWIRGAAVVYLAHRLSANQNHAPVACAESLHRKYKGVHIFPHGGFGIHRHDEGQTSISWRNHLMVLPTTKSGFLSIAPASHTLLTDFASSSHGLYNQCIVQKINALNNHLQVVLLFKRLDGAVRHLIQFLSLSHGMCFIRDRVWVVEDCEISSLRQGMIELMNEYFSEIPTHANGERIIYSESHQRSYPSFVSTDCKDDRFDQLPESRWVNFDCDFGVCFPHSIVTYYHNRHVFNPFHAKTDCFYINYTQKPMICIPSQVLTDQVLLFCPNQNPEQTRHTAFESIPSSSTFIHAYLTDFYLIVVNMDLEHTQEALLSFNAFPIPLFADTIHIHQNVGTLRTTLDAMEIKVIPIKGYVEEGDQLNDLSILVHHGVWIQNSATGPTTLNLTCAGQQHKVLLEANQTYRG